MPAYLLTLTGNSQSAGGDKFLNTSPRGHRHYVDIDTMNKGYQEYLKSAHWKKWRTYKIKSKKRCFVCHTTENLHVHHLKYRKLFDITSKDIKVMCKRCHFMTHDFMKVGKIVFTNDKHKHKMDVIIRILRPIVCGTLDGHKASLKKQLELQKQITNG